MARIYPRGNTYYSDVFFPAHPKADKRGQVRIPLDTDKGFALKKLSAMIEQARAQKHQRAPVFGDWSTFKERFWKLYEHKSPITLRHYKRAVRELEAFQTIRDPQEVTPALLSDLYNHWKTKKRGLYARNRDREYLVAMLRRAEAWELVKRQDWDTVIAMDPEPRGRVDYFTIRELRDIRKKAKGDYLTITLLGARAGLRPGEAFFLEWENVDFRAGKINVEAKPQYAGHVRNYKRREVPMPPDLEDHLRRQFKTKSSQWVVENRWPSTSAYSHAYTKFLRSIGYRGNPYKLRHTYGSHLGQSDERLETIRDLMGHKSTAQTECYVHHPPETLIRAVHRLPKL